MRLHSNVKMFSTELFIDVDNPTQSFFGKIAPFAEMTNPGPSSRRRVLEVAPDIRIPSGRVVASYTGQNYIVADKNVDFWRGEEIRHKYPILPPDGAGIVGSIGQILSGAPEYHSVYVYPYYVRRDVDESTISDYYSGIELYFPNVFTFKAGQILELNGVHYRLRSDSWIDGAGFGVCLAIKLPDAVQLLDIVGNSGGYDPVSDVETGASYPGVKCFVEPATKDYERLSPSYAKIEAGDLAVSVLKADVELKVGFKIGLHKIIGIRAFDSYITAHCRYTS